MHTSSQTHLPISLLNLPLYFIPTYYFSKDYAIVPQTIAEQIHLSAFRCFPNISTSQILEPCVLFGELNDLVFWFEVAIQTQMAVGCVTYCYVGAPVGTRESVIFLNHTCPVHHDPSHSNPRTPKQQSLKTIENLNSVVFRNHVI